MSDDNITQFPPREPPASIVGPPLSGCNVIVEGRVIPQLVCHPQADGRIMLVLDRRFSCVVTADESMSIAWMLANALAIGQGYSNCSAQTRDQPFALRYAVVDRWPGKEKEKEDE